jgi:hypothetical protein
MLETFFESPKMLAHLRAGPSGHYMAGKLRSIGPLKGHPRRDGTGG